MALMNFGIAENVTEKELDEIVVGKNRRQVFDKLGEVTAKTLDVVYSDDVTSPECPNRGDPKSH